MSEFPEKNQLEDLEETSTIFSDPAPHSIKAENKAKRKLLPKIIAAFLAVAILVGGTVAVIKLIPEKEDGSSRFEELKLLDLSSDEFKQVTVTNINGTFTLLSQRQEVDSQTVVTWSIKEYSKDLISSELVKNVTDTLASLTALRKITTKTQEECGLSTPSVTAEIITNADEKISVFLGDKSPDNSGVYMSLSTGDEVYLANKTLNETISFDALSLANTDDVLGVDTDLISSEYKDEDGILSTFDTITLNGKNFEGNVVIKPNSNGIMVEYATYMIVSPLNHSADNSVVSSFVDFFKSGVTSIGAYSFDTSSAELQRLGFDAPDLTASIKIGSYSRTYMFKEQDDGNYAVFYEGCKLIKKIASEYLTIIDYKTEDVYSSWLFPETLTQFKNFTLIADGKTYSFDIVFDDSESATETFVITYNGKKINSENFQTMYAYCTLMECSDFSFTSSNGNPDIKVVLTYSDTAKANYVVEFKKTDVNKYSCTSAGEKIGKINSSAVNKLLKYVENVAAGKAIN